ncbi:hypothetical protein CLV30_102241 [Haloactinopolyspora alba]|uniref:DUF6351 domain-containing protein n=1 Tax=Haloactinopolyspora alba TaxID=648780 RepID=A0A2P8EBM1_9ACTN|nr:DUF6351 family protein [Haloactinopolyspora alba]PSL06852.1 hypothetical protein CLV30_102241 [Haloactinopolyspora alba]
MTGSRFTTPPEHLPGHPRPRRRRRTLAAGAATALVASLAVAAGPVASADDERSGIELSVLSGRPDTVTSGDALVRVYVPQNAPFPRVKVTLDGTDITDAFTPDRDARTLTGLVTGLDEGANQLEATVPGAGGRPSGELTLTNHPDEGPVFSGPHEKPFVCETERFTMPVVGGDLGAPLDENCSIEDRVDYFYRTTGGNYAPWPDGATGYPDDLATTTTSTGDEVPFIVRMETGTANRAIYQTTVLHDPLAGPAPTPSAPSEAWNGRAIFTLGGGCVNGWYRQGNRTGGVTNAHMLGQGYALMSSSLNVFGTNCSDLLAAESAMVTKEEFVERNGPPRHTIGYGCSGGSYQAHQITDNYPGIFDGIVVGCSFPEVGFGTVNFITDAWLIDHYMNTDSAVEWTREQKRSVTGFATYATAPNVANGARRIDPRVFCGVVPTELRYDPETNPGGARCDVYDHTVNAYGTDPETGFARRPLDNVGIQYGLGALHDGSISVEQFLDLNEKIGGFDDDANIVDRRTEGDPVAIEAAYKTGRLTNGGGGLADVPIIDYRAYTDDRPNGDIHVRYHTFSMRERLEKANGTSANHVSLLEDNRYGGFSTNSPLLRHALKQMDAWLTNLGTDDGSTGDRIDEIVAAKPEALVEGCNTRGADPEFIAQPLDRDPDSRCEQLYPSASFPREVAGGDVAADVIKCQLKAPDPADYEVEFTDEQWSRLTSTFAGGVCDWSKPGVKQQGLAGTWLRF